MKTAVNQKNYKNDVTNTQYVIAVVYTEWVSSEVSKFGLTGWLRPYIIISPSLGFDYLQVAFFCY